MARIRQLDEQRVRVYAPRELCFEVVAAAGRVVERRGDEIVATFSIDLGGRKVKTKELLTLERPARISYRWLEGPLPYVEETIDFREVGPFETELVYRGSIARAPIRPSSCFAAWFRVSRRFNRAVTEHLLEAKAYAEARAARSHTYPAPRL